MELNNNTRFVIVLVLCMLFVAYIMGINALAATVMTMLLIIVVCALRRR